jgi:hypothetical protein
MFFTVLSREVMVSLAPINTRGFWGGSRRTAECVFQDNKFNISMVILPINDKGQFFKKGW